MGELNRRQVLKTLGLAAGGAVLSAPLSAATARDPDLKPGEEFIYCLNMSTIRGHNLGFVKELEVASKAGFTAVEIWLDTLQTYLQSGGTPAEAKKIIDGLGLTVADAIGFAPWIADDNATRQKALTDLQKDMDVLAKIGCHRIAAPPAGATKLPLINLDTIAERYSAILNIGRQSGVIPQLEMWGGSVNLQKVSQLLYVVAACGSADARMLLDVFHIYKGQSPVESLAFVGAYALEVLHVNDYPAGIKPEVISEPDRIYVGDGVAPIRQILQLLKHPGKPLILSFEVFNKGYYAQDALVVAKTALAKMKAATASL